MRAKVLLTTCALALAVIGSAVYFRFKPDAPAPAPADAPAVAQNDSSQTAPAGTAVPRILRRVQAAPEETMVDRPSDAASLGLPADDYESARKAQLIDMGMSTNKDSLKTILSELQNSDPEIRKTALQATLDFGSKDAIPALQNELGWATDLNEKMEIQKAIDFLQLPTFGSGAAE